MKALEFLKQLGAAIVIFIGFAIIILYSLVVALFTWQNPVKATWQTLHDIFDAD